jgi:hypothetical protein
VADPVPAFADHERLAVTEMRDADPVPGLITWIQGTCAPSHDRQRLDCYFTTVSVLQMKRSEDEVRKEYMQAARELDQDPAKTIATLRDLCRGVPPDALKRRPGREMILALRTFCERPTREAALSVMRAVIDDQAKTCRCDIGDWRAVFERREDRRWVARLGPSPPCSGMRFLTFLPTRPITRWTGDVVLGTLIDKRVITNVACAEGAKESLRSDPSFRGTLDLVGRLPLSPILSDGEITFSWDAPDPSLHCRFFEFRSMNQLGAVSWGPWPPRVPELPPRLP